MKALQLDSWDTRERPPDLIKVDVEGAEIEVLQGAMNTIEQHRPTLIVEVHRIGFRFKQFVGRRLRPLGYTARTLEGKDLPDQPGIRYHAVLRP